MMSPRSAAAQRRASPWAVDLQLKRGSGTGNSSSSSSRTQRSTSSWKQRMQERKAVFSGVAVAEALIEEDDDEDDDLDGNDPFDVYDSEEEEQQRTEVEIDDNATYVLEVQRMVVLKELKQTVAKIYTGDYLIVESISSGPSNTNGDAPTSPAKQQQQQDQQHKQTVMNDLVKRVSNVYTQDHHVVESSKSSDSSAHATETDPPLSHLSVLDNDDDDDDDDDVEDYDQQGVLLTAQSSPSMSTKKQPQEQQQQPEPQSIAEESLPKTTTTLEVPPALEAPPDATPDAATTDAVQVQQPLDPAPTKMVMTTMATPTKDLPRSHYYFHSTPSKHFEDDDDDRSVFTEVTIEEIVQQMVPLPATAKQTNDFKDQMRKSFLAFEQLVQAKHTDDDDDNDDDDEYEEESIFLNDEKSVMTEMTMDEIVQAAFSSSTNNNNIASVPPKLQAFQQEMKKSFQAFEALLGDDEFDEPEEEAVHRSFEVVSNSADSLHRQRVDSYDEITIQDDDLLLLDDDDEEAEEENKKELLEQNHSFDEITVDETVVALQPPPKEEEEPAVVVIKKKKQERVQQFQEEMKKSFMTFESIVLKQQEAEDDTMTEYTVEEIVDQVLHSQDNEEDESKSFAREMRRSFLAFESLLKQNEMEEESVWEEQTIQESAAAEPLATATTSTPTPVATTRSAVSTPAKALPTTPTTPLVPEAPVTGVASVSPKKEELPKQPQLLPDSASVCSTPLSIKSGKHYDDAISLVESATSGSGKHYSDAISLVGGQAEEEQQPQELPFRNVACTSTPFDGEEKKDDAVVAESPDNLLKQTQRFLTTIGGMVSFDKGDSTDHTEQETLSGETNLPEEEIAVNNVAKDPQPSDEAAIYNALPTASSKRRKDGPMMIFNPLGDLLPPTPPPQAAPLSHEPVTPSKVNVLLNSRMFSDEGLVLPTEAGKHTTPQRNMPVMNVEFSDGGYNDDDDMTQITFDHTVQDTPKKAPIPSPKADEGSTKGDDNASTCSSQESKGIADLLRRDIWSPDVATVQAALEKLGAEASKGPSYRLHIVKFGGLLGVFRAMDMNPNHAGIQMAACTCLERMALDPDTQISIGGVGGIPVIASVMQNNMSNTQIHRAASAALVNISCCPQEDIEGALEAIILSMTKHANDAEVQENSFKALANLTMDSPERLKELSNRGGLAAMTMALQKPWTNKAEHHEAISLLSMLLRNLADCSQ